MKKFLNFLFLLFLLIFLLCFAFIAYARIENSFLFRKAIKEPKVSFYMISHKWHAGLILPRALVEEKIGYLPFPQSPWLEVGWGDKQYYMHDGFSALGAIKALSRSSEGVMHIVTIDENMLENLKYSYKLKEYQVSEHAFYNMLNYLEKSFSEKGLKSPLAPSLYGEGAFLASPFRYHFFFTCNGWIARMMNEAGYKSFPFISQHPITLNMQYP